MATATVREAVVLANKRFMKAFSEGDAVAISGCYASDGQLLPPQSQPIDGREAIASFWKAVMGMGITAVTLETMELVDHDDSAYEVGRYSLAGANGQSGDQGKYMVIWRVEGGEWKLYRDIWNTSAVPSA